MLGSEEQAGALMGPVAAVGWGVFALGSALAGLTWRRLGVARTAILARILNGLGAVVMGLVAGPAALIAAYLFTYALHGSAGPMHHSLLHREAQRPQPGDRAVDQLDGRLRVVQRSSHRCWGCSRRRRPTRSRW